jgi:dynein heavy chain, axonemal
MNLKKNEDVILDLLSNSKGMILDDVDLIESLKQSKQMSNDVQKKLVVSEEK